MTARPGVTARPVAAAREALATSARVRLTLVIAAVLVATGAAITTTVCVVMSVLPLAVVTASVSSDDERSSGDAELLPTRPSGGDGVGGPDGGPPVAPGGVVVPGAAGSSPEAPSVDVSLERTVELARTSAVADTVGLLLMTSLVVLGVALVVGAAVSWFVAGRLLRPVEQLTEAARQIDHGTLHPELDLGGRRDEFGRLAETIRDMLARLDRSYQAQRRFAANASHELRTPLATTQAVLDVALADPSAVDVTRLATQLREVNARSAGTVAALLTLSDAQAGYGEVDDVDLAQVAAAAVAGAAERAQEARVTVTTDLAPVVVRGDRPLLEVLVGNLVVNAVRHNRSGGTAHVALRGRTLTVVNAGDELTEQEVALFPEPFHRRAGRVAGSHGLGLALVAAVAEGHGAELRLAPREGGGLVASVAFPPAD